MLSSKNRAIIASAGSRKTTFLVEKALAIHEKPVLITTYTNENVSQIREYIVQKKGHVPANVEVTSWFGLLLRDGVRPYQNYMTRKPRIDSINFRDTPAPGIGKGDVDRYFLDRGNNVYRDRVADFVCQCDIRSKGLIVRRLENIFGHILIDEFQDFAGYDLEFVERLCTSTIEVLVACDPRQGTYSTHISAKNSRFRRVGILGWLQQKKASGLLVIESAPTVSGATRQFAISRMRYSRIFRRLDPGTTK
jgi:DNA helicase-2/ATP-dependent DNA helicase PcrA